MKRRNRKKGISIYAIIGICFLFLFIMGVIYAQVSQTLFLTGTVRVKEQKDTGVTVKITKQEIIREGEEVIRYNCDYTITNNTDQAVTGWKVIMSNLPKSATEIGEWNHVIAKNDIENGILIFGPKEWNHTISAGAELNIHFSFIATELVDQSKFKIAMYNGTIDPEQPEPDPGEETELTSLSLSPSSKTIKVGETLNLEVTKTPQTATNTLTWTSSNEQVATVDSNGKVTALAAGTTIITVSSGNITATSNITVKENVVTPPSTEGLTAKFEVTASWASSIQFRITITNNTGNDIQGCNFNLDVPEGSTYTIWSNATNSGNNISYNQLIASKTSSEIYGQIDLPEGCLAEDYLTPTITNLQAQ